MHRNVSKSGAMGGLARQNGNTATSSRLRSHPSGGYSSLWRFVQCCGLLLHLVGKGQLFVYSEDSYGNGKLGDSIWESHHKSSAQGAHKANTTPHRG